MEMGHGPGDCPISDSMPESEGRLGWPPALSSALFHGPWPQAFQPPDSPPEGGGAPASQGLLAEAMSVSAHAGACPDFVVKVSACASKSCQKGSPPASRAPRSELWR